MVETDYIEIGNDIAILTAPGELSPALAFGTDPTYTGTALWNGITSWTGETWKYDTLVNTVRTLTGDSDKTVLIFGITNDALGYMFPDICTPKSMLATAMQVKGNACAVMDADITGPSIPKAFGVKGPAMQNELGLLPVKTKTGIEVMSINLLLESEDSPVRLNWSSNVISSDQGTLSLPGRLESEGISVSMNSTTGTVTFSVKNESDLKMAKEYEIEFFLSPGRSSHTCRVKLVVLPECKLDEGSDHLLIAQKLKLNVLNALGTYSVTVKSGGSFIDVDSQDKSVIYGKDNGRAVLLLKSSRPADDPELTPDGMVVKNPGNLVMQDAAFITTGIDESFKKGSADNRIVRKGNYWQIAGADCSAVPWTFEMGSGTFFQFEGLKLYKSIATWGGPMVLSGDVKTLKISSAITGSTERNQNWLVFTNVVTGAGGIVNNIAATATDLNYMGGGVRLANPNNSFEGAVKLNRTELDLDASGALPKDGKGAGLRDCTLVFKEGVDYELPGCSIYNTGVVTNGTGKWTKPFVKYEDGDLAYKSLVGFSELEVLGGTVTFEASEVEPVKIDTFVATNAALKGEIAFNGRTCELGGLLLDGAALNDAATASFVTDGKVVFAQGAKLTLAGQRKFRSNRAPVTVATAAGGFEGTIEVADPLPKREYRLYVDGNDLKLECQSGMLIMVR